MKKKTSLYAVRTTVGQEKSIAMILGERAKGMDGIKAILVPEDIRGYIVIEAEAKHHVQRAIIGMRHVRGKIIPNIDISEIEHFLIPHPPTEGLSVGDLVEIIGGPFKGEKAMITQIKQEKEEVVLQLLESSYPIPIKVHASFIRLIEKGQSSEIKEETLEE